MAQPGTGDGPAALAPSAIHASAICLRLPAQTCVSPISQGRSSSSAHSVCGPGSGASASRRASMSAAARSSE
ncbi:MAG: hypothetical protein R3B82_20400 [Sandaracinaceae bacterium]